MGTLNSEMPAGARPAPQQPQLADAPAASFTGGTAFEQAAYRLEHANKALKKHIADVVGQGDYLTDAGREAAIASFRNTPAAQDIDVAEHQWQARLAEIEAEAQQVKAGLTQPGDAAEEARRGRYWNRTKPLLDKEAPGHIASAAQQLLNDATPDQLGVLAEELPAYLQARGHGSDFVEPVVAQKVPKLGAAQRKLAKARQGATVLRHTATAVRAGIQKGRPVQNLVPLGPYDPDRE